MAQEISREAVLIYLNDIRMLETMLAESNKKYHNWKKNERIYSNIIFQRSAFLLFF